MQKFPALLRTAAVDCNRARTPLLIGVFIVGCVVIAVSVMLWRTALRSGLKELGTVIGPEAAVRIETNIRSAATGPAQQQALATAIADIQAAIGDMPEEQQQQALATAFGRIAVDVMPVLIGFVLLSMILHLWSRAFFLLTAMRPQATFGALAGEAITWMLPLLAVCFLGGVAFFAFGLTTILLTFLLSRIAAPLMIVAFVAAAVVLVLYVPRFAFAPAVLVQDDTGIIESFRKSYRITKGRWGKIVGNMIGATAMVWIAFFLAQFFLQLVLRALPPSPYVLLLGQLMTFVSLLCTAYLTIFYMRLKEAIVSKK